MGRSSPGRDGDGSDVAAVDRQQRRAVRHRARRRRFLVVATVLIAAVAGIGAWKVVGGKSGKNGATSRQVSGSSPSLDPAISSSKPLRPAVVYLAAASVGALPSPVQDASAAFAGPRRAIVLGGLTAADFSTRDILLAGRAGTRRIGALPLALHDAGAARIGSWVYVFGGGDGTRQHAEIIRVDPRTGRATVVGRIPAPSSDQSVAAIGRTAYVVGGYTGSRWLDTIVAWKPGSPAQVVAHLPSPLRYAAVTAVGGRLVIAGGSLASGAASDAVFEYTPAGARVSRLGRLPAPTTHAAAATLGDVAFVIGGRGPKVGTPTSSIVAIDVSTGLVRLAGRLPQPLSDLAAVAFGGEILVVGGRGRSGTVATLQALRPVLLPPRVPAVTPRVAVPALLDARNVYAADGANELRGAARFALSRVYVPNSQSNTVDVIDPRTFKVVAHFAVGGLPQHVVPSYDLKTLYVTNDTGNSLTPIDPRTGKPGRSIPVADPYNMYFTPDGRYAIVVAERLRQLDFRDAHTFRLHRSVHVPCTGVDHIDFSADGSYLLASCEFSGQLVKVDVGRERVSGTLTLRPGAAPQDVKLSPDGRVFYVADMAAGGVWKIDGRRLRTLGFLRTGLGTHGLYPSRDAKLLYVTNRAEGSVSLVSFRTGKLVGKWRIPGGGSPDMGNVSADGKVLWLTGRWNSEVYAISTADGRLLARIPVGQGPHGLTVWPQPGRYSLGHTGVLR